MKPKKPATGTRLSLELRTQLETLADTTEGRGTEVLRLPAGLVSRAMAGEELSAAGHERVIAALDRVRAEQAPEASK